MLEEWGHNWSDFLHRGGLKLIKISVNKKTSAMWLQSHLSMCKTGHRYLTIDQYHNMTLITLPFVSYKPGNITLYHKEYFNTSLLGCVPSKMACSRPCGTLGCMYHSRRRRWRKTFSLDMPG